MPVDAAVRRAAASVWAIKAINAPRFSKSVGFAADTDAISDESAVESVAWVEFCVFARDDTVCQHKDSKLPE